MGTANDLDSAGGGASTGTTVGGTVNIDSLTGGLQTVTHASGTVVFVAIYDQNDNDDGAIAHQPLTLTTTQVNPAGAIPNAKVKIFFA